MVGHVGFLIERKFETNVNIHNKIVYDIKSIRLCQSNTLSITSYHSNIFQRLIDNITYKYWLCILD